MKTYQIPQTNIEVSRISYGCMNLGGRWDQTPLSAAERANATKVVMTAYEQGITMFDHADIYAMGKSEAVFGEILQQRPGWREKIILLTKCGIRFPGDPNPDDPARYDFSYQHIIKTVEGSLGRLRTDYVDILLLHRPDALVEPEEVAAAFAELHRSGKVRYFGVSNHTGAQIDLLKKYVEQPLVINQLEINLLHSGLINEGIIVNQTGGEYTEASGILDYCRLHDIMIQAWSPVAKGALIAPPADAEDRVLKTADMIAAMAAAKGTTREAIALAWLLRHPAGIQPVVGTTNSDRLVASCQADSVHLSREEWYTLFVTARGNPVP